MGYGRIRWKGKGVEWGVTGWGGVRWDRLGKDGTKILWRGGKGEGWDGTKVQWQGGGMGWDIWRKYNY